MKHFARVYRCAMLIASAILLPAQNTRKSAEPDLAEMVTDRPDFTESTAVVGVAIVQLESGFRVDRTSASGAHTRSLTGPFPLLRLGVSKRIELRFGGDGYSWQRVTSKESDHRAKGGKDYSIGAKVKFFAQSAVLPDFAIVAAVTAPQGHPAFRGAGYDPEIKLCLAKNAPFGFTLASNLNIASISDSAGRFVGRAVTLSGGHGVWRGLDMFAEAYNLTLDRTLGHSTIVNAGLTHPVGNSAQVDVVTGHSVAGRQVGWFIAVGLSIRQSLLPNLRR